MSEKDLNIDQNIDALRNSLSAKGKVMWDVIAENKNIELSRDCFLIIQLVEVFEEYNYLKTKIKKKRNPKDPNDDPRLHQNPNGTIQTHPFVQQLREARLDIKSLTAQLALSPAAAAKLRIIGTSDTALADEVMKSDR